MTDRLLPSQPKKNIGKAAESKERVDQEKEGRQRLHAVIGERVMHALDLPDDLYKVQVRPLWEDHYRVNVFTGVDGVLVKFSHSFFLSASDDGNIIASSPEIAKKC